jgi:hypothetical protein
MHVVAVRVEHQQRQPRPEHQLLQEPTEAVGLPRPRLPAQERVPAEALRLQPSHDLGCVTQRAQLQGGCPPSQPFREQLVGCHGDADLVERQPARWRIQQPSVAGDEPVAGLLQASLREHLAEQGALRCLDQMSRMLGPGVTGPGAPSCRSRPRR